MPPYWHEQWILFCFWHIFTSPPKIFSYCYLELLTIWSSLLNIWTLQHFLLSVPIFPYSFMWKTVILLPFWSSSIWHNFLRFICFDKQIINIRLMYQRKQVCVLCCFLLPNVLAHQLLTLTQPNVGRQWL